MYTPEPTFVQSSVFAPSASRQIMIVSSDCVPFYLERGCLEMGSRVFATLLQELEQTRRSKLNAHESDEEERSRTSTDMSPELTLLLEHPSETACNLDTFFKFFYNLPTPDLWTGSTLPSFWGLLNLGVRYQNERCLEKVKAGLLTDILLLDKLLPHSPIQKMVRFYISGSYLGQEIVRKLAFDRIRREVLGWNEIEDIRTFKGSGLEFGWQKDVNELVAHFSTTNSMLLTAHMEGAQFYGSYACATCKPSLVDLQAKLSQISDPERIAYVLSKSRIKLPKSNSTVVKKKSIGLMRSATTSAPPNCTNHCLEKFKEVYEDPVIRVRSLHVSFFQTGHTSHSGYSPETWTSEKYESNYNEETQITEPMDKFETTERVEARRPLVEKSKARPQAEFYAI